MQNIPFFADEPYPWDSETTPDATFGQHPHASVDWFGPSTRRTIPFDLSRRLGLSALRSYVDVLLGIVSTIALRAQLTAALTKEAKGHEEWSRCLTNGEAKEWAGKLTTITIMRYGLEAAEAAKIANKVAYRARRFSHHPRAQAKRARDQGAKLSESQRPRDEGWMRDHDELGMTWKAIGDRDGVSRWTVRNAVVRLRKRLGLKRIMVTTSSTDSGPGQRPSTVRGTVRHAPPDTLPSSPRLAPVVAIYRILQGLAQVIERGEQPIEAVMEVVAPLQRRMQDINAAIEDLKLEKDAIYGALACAEAV